MNAKQIAERLRHGIPDFDTMAEAADLLERMAWVPVSERLPSESGFYDVWRPNFGRWASAYWWDEWLDDMGGDSIEPVTHWRYIDPPSE